MFRCGLLLMLLMLLSAGVLAQCDRVVYIDGHPMMSLRAFSEKFDAEVGYDTWRDAITITLYDRTVYLRPYSRTAWVDDCRLQLEQPAVIIDDITYVPLRFLAEAFELDCDWGRDEEQVTFHITTINIEIILVRDRDWDRCRHAWRYHYDYRDYQHFPRPYHDTDYVHHIDSDGRPHDEHGGGDHDLPHSKVPMADYLQKNPPSASHDRTDGKLPSDERERSQVVLPGSNTDRASERLPAWNVNDAKNQPRNQVPSASTDRTPDRAWNGNESKTQPRGGNFDWTQSPAPGRSTDRTPDTRPTVNRSQPQDKPSFWDRSRTSDSSPRQSATPDRQPQWNQTQPRAESSIWNRGQNQNSSPSANTSRGESKPSSFWTRDRTPDKSAGSSPSKSEPQVEKRSEQKDKSSDDKKDRHNNK